MKNTINIPLLFVAALDRIRMIEDIMNIDEWPIIDSYFYDQLNKITADILEVDLDTSFGQMVKDSDILCDYSDALYNAFIKYLNEHPIPKEYDFKISIKEQYNEEFNQWFEKVKTHFKNKFDDEMQSDLEIFQ